MLHIFLSSFLFKKKGRMKFEENGILVSFLQLKHMKINFASLFLWCDEQEVTLVDFTSKLGWDALLFVHLGVLLPLADHLVEDVETVVEPFACYGARWLDVVEVTRSEFV